MAVDKSICTVISSGSHGNAVLYHESILIDIGVNFKPIEPYKDKIKVVALTHEHLSDHLNIKTLKKLQFEKPLIRICCGEWMVKFLDGLRNIDVLESGIVYDYGLFSICPVELYHDDNVPNFGYRIFKDGHKSIHITDTCHVIGIEAKNYDLIAIEHNYNEETIFKNISKSKQKGEFTHLERSVNTHLSEQQARDFLFKNAGEYSQIIRLHESKMR